MLYGKKSILLLLVLCMPWCGFLLLRQGWNDYGMIKDGGKAGFSGSLLWEEKPVIDTGNRHVEQNEKIRLCDLASARDVSGEDLTGQIVFQDEKGKKISGWLNTEQPGVYPLVVSVCSIATGRKSQKRILILVDGRVSA